MTKHMRVKPSRIKENQVLPQSKSFDYDMKDDNFEKISKGFIPPNTAADTCKCVCLFQEWAKKRNAHFLGEKVPDDLLLTDDNKSLSRCLSKICAEIRKVDGTRHPPRTIQHYLLGIQWHIRKRKEVHINFFADSDFNTLCKLVDVLYRKLRPEGIGCSVNQTKTLTTED